MKPFATTLLTCLAAAAAINVGVDAAGSFRRAEIDLSGWAPGTVLTAPPDFDDRAFRLRHVRRIARPQTLMLGSSRALSFQASMFPGQDFYVAGLPGAVIEDQLGVWEALRSADKTPARLVVLADPWLLNATRPQARYLSVIDWTERFLRRRAATDAAMRRPWRQAVRRRLLRAARWAEISEALSWGALKASIASRSRRRDSAASASGWRWDGSRVMPPEEDSRSPEEARRLAEQYGREADVYGFAQFVWDDAASAMLEALLRDAREAGAATVVVTPPYHPAAQRELDARPRYRELLSRTSDELRAVAARSGAEFCSAADEAVCPETEFVDGMHMRAACARRIVDRCLSVKVAGIRR